MTNLTIQEKQRLEYLFGQYIANKAEEEEIKELGLLSLDPKFKPYIIELMKGDWETFRSAINLKPEHTQQLLGKIQSRVQNPVKTLPLFHNLQMSWRIAASLVFISITMFILYRYKSDFFGLFIENLVEVSSPTGKQTKVVLPDGSIVWLNAESSLSYPRRFEKEKRAISLKGEAFFEVTRNEQQPFIITSHDISVKVLGTSFNVKTYGNEPSEVTVVTGKVQVSADQNSNVKLTPNQQVMFSKQGGFSPIKQVKSEGFMSWKEGIILFDDKNLKDLTVILERWYGKKIILKNNKLNNCQLVGRHKNKSLKEILNSIQFILDIEYQTKGDSIIINGPGCE